VALARPGRRARRYRGAVLALHEGFLLVAARPISRPSRRGSTCFSSRARPGRRRSCSGSSPTVSWPIGVCGSGLVLPMVAVLLLQFGHSGTPPTFDAWPGTP